MKTKSLIIKIFCIAMFCCTALFSAGIEIPDPDTFHGVRTKWLIHPDFPNVGSSRHSIIPQLSDMSVADFIKHMEELGLNALTFNLENRSGPKRTTPYYDTYKLTPYQIERFDYSCGQRNIQLINYLLEVQKAIDSGYIKGTIKFHVHQRLYIRNSDRSRENRFIEDFSKFINLAKARGVDHLIAGIRLGEHGTDGMDYLLAAALRIAETINTNTGGWLKNYGGLEMSGDNYGQKFTGINTAAGADTFFQNISQHTGYFTFCYKSFKTKSTLKDDGSYDVNSKADWKDFLLNNSEIDLQSLINFIQAHRDQYPLHANVIYVGDSGDALKLVVEPEYQATTEIFTEAGAGFSGIIAVNGYRRPDKTDADNNLYILDALVDNVNPVLKPNSLKRWSTWPLNESVTDTYRKIDIRSNIGGVVNPSGPTFITNGGDLDISLAANNGFSVSDVLIDGISKGALSSVSLTNVTSNTKVEVVFKKDAGTIFSKTIDSKMCGVWKLDGGADIIELLENGQVLLNGIENGLWWFNQGSGEIFSLDNDNLTVKALALENQNINRLQLTVNSSTSTYNRLSETATWTEDFSNVAEMPLASDGTTSINGTVYTGSTANIPDSKTYQTQIKHSYLENDEYLSLWCEESTQGDISWDASGNPAQTVSSVIIDVPDGSFLTSVSMDIGKRDTENNWWYRVQYTDDENKTWKSLDEIDTTINVPSVHVNIFQNLYGVDALRVSVWRNGGSDPEEMMIDNISYSAPQISDSVTLELTGNYLDTQIDGVQGGAARTVSAWFKTSATGNETIWSWGEAASTKRMELSVKSAGSANNANNIKLGVGTGVYATTGLTVNDGEWHHVAVVQTGANLNTVKVYVDGSAFVSDVDYGIATVNTNKFRIGTSVKLNNHFDGSIDEVAMFSRALSGSEVSNIYLNGIGRGRFKSVNSDIGSAKLITDSSLKLFYDASTRKDGKAILLTDGSGTTAEATFVNNATTSAPSNFSVSADNFTTNSNSFSTSSTTVLSNDDITGSVSGATTVEWGAYTGPTAGSLSATDTAGNFTYTFSSAPSDNDSDTFTYVLKDTTTGAKEIAEATVTFSVSTPAIGLQVSLSETELVWAVEDEIGVKEYQVIVNGKLFDTVVAVGVELYSIEVPADSDVELKVVDESGFSKSYKPQDGNVKIEIYDLEEGWNLIAMTSDDADIKTLEDETVGVVWGWNGTAYESVENPRATDAVWVYAPTAKQIYVSGTKSDAVIELSTGWNMVGPVENDYIPAEAHTVYSWSKIYDIIAGEDKVLIGGKGYWIFSL